MNEENFSFFLTLNNWYEGTLDFILHLVKAITSLELSNQLYLQK